MIENCTVCGGVLAPHFPEVRDPLTGESFAVYKCKRCGIGQTFPMPQDLSKYYGLEYYGNRHGLTLRRSNKRRLGFVASAVGRGSGRWLLDVGCGDGSFLLAARDVGWNVMGTELNPQPARDAGLDVKRGVDQVPLERQFDCVTMWHSLEHMWDSNATLARIGSLLKPEGKLLIAVPDSGGFQAKIFSHRWFHLDVPRHLYHFDAGSLKFCLQSAGYAIESQWHQEFEYDLLGWSQSASNCIMSYQNVFFDFLTGKQRRYGKWIVALSFVLGSVLSIFALPFVAAGTLAGRGGTIVVAASRRNEQRRV